MRIAIVADTFPPMRTSGAVQLRDLATDLSGKGHLVTIFLPDADLLVPWADEFVDGYTIVRLKSPRAKELNYFRRTLAEIFMPLSMLLQLRRSPYMRSRFDGVVWYSPSIFLAPFVHALKVKSRALSYLIIRDIFPKWAFDLGLIRKGMVFNFFNWVARYQYSIADVIGVQSHGDLCFVEAEVKSSNSRIEVLANWLSEAPVTRCSIDIGKTRLAGRKIFLYAGNMGPAQGMSVLLEFVRLMNVRRDLGFVFVGRGSESTKLAEKFSASSLSNVLVYDEIEPREIPGLCSQCHVGIVSLDMRHKSNNIPGKFLSYIRAGLPVLACVNPDSDLGEIIKEEKIGEVVEDGNPGALAECAQSLIESLDNDSEMSERCRSVFRRCFSTDAASTQILHRLLRATD